MLFLAVHAGAGFHQDTDEPALVLLCKRACAAGLNHYTASHTGEMEAVASAAQISVAVLEDSPLTNAGIG